MNNFKNKTSEVKINLKTLSDVIKATEDFQYFRNIWVTNIDFFEVQHKNLVDYNMNEYTGDIFDYQSPRV